LSSHDLKKRASSASRSSIGVSGFDELRRFARAGCLRKKKILPYDLGDTSPAIPPAKGEASQNINK
jgi:hypothetical protein